MAKKKEGTHFNSYDEVLDYLQKRKRTKNLLLGNGFSMAFNPNIFSYNALQSHVAKEEDPTLEKLFDTIKTTNFEEVMQSLDILIKLAQTFEANQEFIDNIKLAYTRLQERLMVTIDKIHPEHVFKLTQPEINLCGDFINPFLSESNTGKVFSTNYDLLLYWVLMRYRDSSDDLIHCDGFGKERIDGGGQSVPAIDRIYSDDLIWGENIGTQNVFYLHGALHLFDDRTQIIKEKYDGTLIMEKIHNRIGNKQYPIFVTAGTGDEKLNHIMHNGYLADAYNNLKNISGSLITVGFGFGDYDKHIIQAIKAAASQSSTDCLRSVYVGVFNETDKKYIESISGEFGCKVNTFDSSKMKIWKEST
ncbi:MAG: DUF4917 family protein [Peptostreptococcaceae bacterium]|nr:DUF4917 family protein [Peptostreptococcaceae bacterium]